MKGFKIDKYGEGDNLYRSELGRVEIGDSEVLLKVEATSLNASDIEFMRGKPVYIRMWGLFKPRVKVLGSDISGRIIKVGKNVKNFNIGDEVFADNFDSWGGFAEYVSIKESRLVHKAEELSHIEASAIPQGAVVALQGLKKGNISKGKRVLIIGAGGGAGTFAIQLAKMYGAIVDGVDSGHKVEVMKQLGVDKAIDYKKEAYYKRNVGYDIILDFVGSESLLNNNKVLKESGSYVMVGGRLRRIVGSALFGPILGRVSRKSMGVLAHRINQGDLNYIAELCVEGSIKVVIDKVYNFDNIPEAMKYLARGENRGKVVIKMDDE